MSVGRGSENTRVRALDFANARLSENLLFMIVRYTLSLLATLMAFPF